MKHLIWIAILLVGMQLQSQAQKDGKDLTPKDPKAKAILDELTEKNKGYNSIKVSFDYILENPSQGLNETQKGEALMKGKEKYVIKMAGRELYCDGVTIWTLIPDVELQINDVPDAGEDDENLFNPANLFTIYEKGFKYRFEGEENRDGVEVQIIDLFPTDPKGKQYHTIQIVVNKAKKQIHSMIVYAKDGNKYIYKLTSFETNIAVKDSDFTLDEDNMGDEIDIIDLR